MTKTRYIKLAQGEWTGKAFIRRKVEVINRYFGMRDEGGELVVTHIPTGYAAARMVPTKKAARAMVRDLMRLRSDWSFTDPSIGSGIKGAKDIVRSHGAWSFLMFALALSACGPVSNPLVPEPIAPAVGIERTPGEQRTLPPPTANYTYTWNPSQYVQEVTIHNGSLLEARWLLAVFESHYAEGHPEFLERQILYRPSLKDIVLQPGETRTTRTLTPEGCDIYHQGDLYFNLRAEDVIEGRVNIHPAASPKVHEVSFHQGKSRAVCPMPEPAQEPPPAPVPPVTPPAPEPPVVPPPTIVPCNDFVPIPNCVKE